MKKQFNYMKNMKKQFNYMNNMKKQFNYNWFSSCKKIKQIKNYSCDMELCL